jgi:3-deoxy-manno-octulosonate cytidylyltransferase (CMP-KDO synthetase)
MTTFLNEEEFHDMNTAKVVVDANGFALYFSRSPIPHVRSGVPSAARRHVGLYAYRAGALRAMARLPVCEIERHERLEQLRALWNGLGIVVADACVAPARGVDSDHDLEAIRAIVSGAGQQAQR